MDIAFIILGLIALVVIGYLGLWMWYKTQDRKREEDMVFLQLVMPKKEGKEDKEHTSEQFSTGQDFKEILGVMDHLYQSLYGIYNTRYSRFIKGQDFFSVEYAALGGEILFFIVCPRHIVHLIEKQLTSFYPEIIINEVEDYNIFTEDSHVAAQTLLPAQNYSFTFKTYQELKSDPLNAISNAFSKLSEDEGAAVQFVIRPAAGGWQKKLQKAATKMINPRKDRVNWYNPVAWLSAFFSLLTSSEAKEVVDVQQEEMTGKRVTQVQEERSKILDEKATNPGYHCVVRTVGSSETQAKAESVLAGIISAFAQFDTVRGNSFKRPHIVRKGMIVQQFIRRSPRRTFRQWIMYPKMLVGTSELASFFHLPNIKYNKIDMIKWQDYKLAPAPKDLPNEGLYLGNNTIRGEKKKIFMTNEDRFRHFYIIGQTGTGKSSSIQLMARQDFHNGKGLCVVDPHGSLIEDLLPYIPRDRADDVIYFNPADTERPMGLNILEADTPEEQDLVALDAMNMMVKMFGEEIFGPRIQDYFRNGCLTLMADQEDGGAITDLVKLFTDDEWQKYKVSKVTNPIVRAFWEKQMAQTGQREKQEMIPYFAAKFGQFYTNALIRNIVGQTKSAFDISKCMSEGKILLMNLSKGLVGDINAQLLGMIAVSKIQVAAMRRQRQDKEARKDFFLYIDEFQNFVTPSIESILSEARKYRLGLILAHQYIDQLEKDSKLSGAVSLKGAIFGNVGSMMFYKIGPQDAEVCAKEMAPVFSEQDLINIDSFRGAMKLSVNNQPSRPFSIEVPRPWLDKTFPKDEQAAEAMKQLSRLTYGRQKDFVDREILRRIG
ncbi:MAG: type IV secretion system DNA-binding domain-containing protein [Candidatus Peribacteraceae bacterium]|nr:type IV secretion system DNA-binding domain-containing protein [Candidatus Peribacteraceae bacterium]